MWVTKAGPHQRTLRPSAERQQGEVGIGENWRAHTLSPGVAPPRHQGPLPWIYIPSILCSPTPTFLYPAPLLPEPFTGPVSTWHQVWYDPKTCSSLHSLTHQNGSAILPVARAKSQMWLRSAFNCALKRMDNNKGNYKQNEKTTYEMGENIYKWCNRQGINFQNIQTPHTTQ